MQKEEIQSLIGKVNDLKQEIHKNIIGQEEVVEQLLMTLFAGGHALLEGVPGLAKTLMISSLAQAVDLKFKRIQFTPDLMPSDIIGTEILQTDSNNGTRNFQFLKGPIFANIILADEINRTPPKTQAALLEAMQERSVSYAGHTYPMAKPFFILATQNPVEQAGTFPLPEAQLDRFLLYIKMDYPSESTELEVLESTTGTTKKTINAVLNGVEIETLQQLVREVHINRDLLKIVNQLVRNTRPQNSNSDFVKEWVQWGAGPRAGQAIILAAKAKALLQNRYAVVEDDLRAVSLAAMRHRILLNFKAEAEGMTTDQVIEELLKKN
ncbi:MAG TPA: AAA family ATPase [Saprospiraceae bacterium]|nr:AAA family ATPase [Saprospiraceae bacterium]